MNPYREIWNRFINEKAWEDAWYQELLRDCLTLEPEYIRIRDALSERDQDLLEHYISACEEMGYWKLQLAAPFDLTKE